MINQALRNEVIPYGANASVRGIVSAINPVMDENGIIKVTVVLKALLIVFWF